MNKQIEHLMQRIKELENELAFELEIELTVIRERFNYSIEQGKIRFQKAAVAAQKTLKMDLYHYLREANILFVLSAPVIYSLILPLLVMDLFITLYQHICFPMYGIKKVVRSEYLIIDRQYLAYLNVIEKLNCIYCGYGNGLLSYSLEIASRTETFWCPIKHARNPPDAHSRYHLFSEYGDATAYRQRLPEIRKKL